MTRQLNLAGKNSNEIYTLFYPNNLINFCKYDFSLFLDHCTDLCRLAARTGEFNIDDVYSIRNSISGCHKYYEQNMRSKFEKIVIDCWIDYLCRQSEVGVGTLWQSFMHCRNDFERAIFMRLSEYRHNKAINEWVNLLRLQEYAQRKVEFVFGVTLSGPNEAYARAGYFDLMFNVAANEQGFPVDEIASTDILTVCRLSNSPFIMTSAAREIARNQLKDMPYLENGYKSRKNPELTDKTAMDAFAVIKEFIPNKNDTMAKTIVKSMISQPQTVYLPRSFKAVIDLEIDAIINSGAVIAHCARCGEYYLKDESYTSDYCNRPQKDGLTCLEVMSKSTDETVREIRGETASYTTAQVADDDDEDFNVIYVDKAVVNEKMEALYKEMAARVNVDMTQRDFSRWYQCELRLKERILLGQAGEKELNDFIELSHGDEFASKKQEPVFEPQRRKEEIEYTDGGREVKRFVFEKVDRPIEQPKAPSSLAQSEKAAMEAVQKLFNQPTVQPRQEPQPAYRQPQMPQHPSYAYPYYPPYQSQQKPVTRIIRGGYGEKMPETPLVKPKTVVIPNGNEPKRSAPETFKPVVSEAVRTDFEVKPVEKTENDDSDVKVFRPKIQQRPETTPYERLKQPLEDFRREYFSEQQEPQLDGQISVEDYEEPKPAYVPTSRPLPANALSAYRSGLQESSNTNNEREKVDFTDVLSGIQRDDGFGVKETDLNSEGLPVTHKTKHVMNALFGPSKASPFLRINLDDDDE